jgi:NitT/TauT family transport system substrate-binding protein
MPTLLLILAAMLLAVAAPDHARAADAVTLRLDWATVATYHSPFYLGEARGHYREAGIDLKILEGKGSGNTVQLVGNGADTFGLVDAAVAAKSISVGVPVKVVMGLIRKSPVALMYNPDRGIRTPQDLKGKTVATCPGHGGAILLPAYLKAINLAPTDIKLLNMDCSAVLSMVGQGKVDVATGYGPVSTTIIQGAGLPTVKWFGYADAGIVLPSHGIVAAQKTIESNPDLVRRFVAATTRAWMEAQKNPDAAVEALVRAAPNLKGRETRLKAEMEEYFAHYVNTAGTAGKPFGWQSPDEWKKAEAILVQYMDVKAQPSVDAYFTNDFIGK